MSVGGLDVDFQCWFCARAFERAEVEHEGMLVPRRRDEGGPYLVYTCPTCERTSRLERNLAGAFLATPPPIVPIVDALFATFDANLAKSLAKKREHFQRRAGRREWFFGQYADELRAAGLRADGDAKQTRRAAAERARRQAEAARARRAKRRAAREPDPAPEPKAPEEPSAPEPPSPEPKAAPPQPAPPPPSSPREVLGLPSEASRQDVVKAFRELAKRYHPDRFEALDSDFRELAHAKFLTIKAAYDALLEELPESPKSGV